MVVLEKCLEQQLISKLLKPLVANLGDAKGASTLPSGFVDTMEACLC